MNPPALFDSNIPELPTLTKVLQAGSDPANVTNILWLQEDRLLALRKKSKLAQIWSTNTGTIDWTFELPKMGVHQALNLPDGRGLLVIFEDNQAALIEPEWGGIVWSPSLSNSYYPLKACLSANGAVLYLLRSQLQEQELSAWQIGEERPLWRTTWKPPGYGQYIFSMSRAGATLFLCDGIEVTRRGTQTGEILSQQKMSYEGLTGVTAIDDQQVVITSLYDQTLGDGHRDYYASLALHDTNQLWITEGINHYDSILYRAPLLYCFSRYAPDLSREKWVLIHVRRLQDGAYVSLSQINNELLPDLSLSPSQEQLAILSDKSTISLYRWNTQIGTAKADQDNEQR